MVCRCDDNEEKMLKLKEVILENRDKKGALIPVLHEAQEIFGYLPKDAQEVIAEGLNVPLSDVYGVITFYTHFKLKPKGEVHIGVCQGTACYVKNSQKVMDKIREELGLEAGETSENLKFSLEETRCIGACGLAPVVTVNDKIHAKILPEDVKGIIYSGEDS